MAGKTRAANGEGRRPIQRADGRWWSQATYYDAKGLSKRKDIYASTSKECVQKKRAFLADIQTGKLPSNSKQTVTQFISEWLATRRDLSARTIEGYEMYLRRHIETSKLGQKVLAEVQRADIRTFMAGLADKKIASGKKQLAPGTIRRIMAVVGSALRVAYGDGILLRDPMHQVKLPPPGEPRLDTLTPAQVRKLWQAVQNHPMSALFALAPTLACREGELLALKWSSVVLDGPEPHIKIVASLGRVKGKGLVFGPPKSKAGLREIPLGKDQVAVLKAHRVRQNTVRLNVGEMWEDNDLVFCTMSAAPGPLSFGKPLDKGNILRHWRKICKRAGLPMLTFHALRHTALTQMAAAGVNPETIRQIAGHSDVRITLAWYTHPTQGVKRQAIDKLSDLYASAPDEDSADGGANTPPASGTEGGS